MKEQWTELIITLHPILVTGLFVLLFIGASAANISDPFGNPLRSAIWAVGMAAMTVPLVLWHYSLFDVAERKSAARSGVSSQRPFFFAGLALALPILLVFIVMSTIKPTPAGVRSVVSVAVPISLMATVISYFGAIGSAASALVRFEVPGKREPLLRTIFTFILGLYLPIGVWFLHPRIRKMLAKDPTTQE